MRLQPIERQTIVITGASSGIGLVTARMAARAGAQVVLAARNEDALRRIAAQINELGGSALAVPADVGKEEDVQRLYDRTLEEFGGFDTWVNNAGVSIFGSCEEVSIADMKRMFDTNFWGVVYGSRLAVKHFKARGVPGSLINIGSFFGDRGTPVQSTYSASKHAVHGWTDSLRMELEADHAPVSVTLIHPGRIDTPYNEHARSYLENEPAHRGMIYPPEAVAEAILHAAQHPKRDIYVGSQAKLAAVFGNMAPRLTDKVMERIMFRSQQADRPSHGPETDALHKPGVGLKEQGNHQGAVYRSRSLYVEATKRPLLTSVAVAGIGLALGAFVRSRWQAAQNAKAREARAEARRKGAFPSTEKR